MVKNYIKHEGVLMDRPYHEYELKEGVYCFDGRNVWLSNVSLKNLQSVNGFINASAQIGKESEYLNLSGGFKITVQKGETMWLIDRHRTLNIFQITGDLEAFITNNVKEEVIPPRPPE